MVRSREEFENYTNPLLEGLDNYDPKVMTQLLENHYFNSNRPADMSFNSEVLLEASEGTKYVEMDLYDKVLFPLIRKAWPQLAANYAVSTQAMNGPTGLIRFLNIYRDPDSGSITEVPLIANSTFSQPTTTNTSVSLVSGQIGYSAYITGSGTTAITPAPTVTYVDSTGSNDFSVVCDHNGDFNVPSICAGHIEYDTAKYFIVFQDAPGTGDTLTVSWQAYSGSMTPNNVKVKLEEQSVTAGIRKLGVEWEFEAQHNLASMHDVNLATELVDALSKEVAQEIDMELLQMVFDNVSASNSFDLDYTGSPWEVTPRDWYEMAMLEVGKLASYIYENTRRGTGNVLIGSPKVSAVFKGMNNYKAKDATVNASPYNVGSLVGGAMGTVQNQYTMVESLAMTTISENDVIVLYKGNNIAEVGGIYAPYIPVQLTPIIYNSTTGQPKRIMHTMYAKKMINSYYYTKLTFNFPANWSVTEL